MTSSSVLSSGLGVCRGYFVGKSSPIRRFRFVSNENRSKSSRNCRCSTVSQKSTCRQGMLLLPVQAWNLPSSPWRLLPKSECVSICLASSSNAAVVAEEEVEVGEVFVEVGLIANTHGLQGELHVHSLTDFPRERFEKPGLRWLRTLSMGRSSLQQVELLKGRIGPGRRPSWLITLKDFNSQEKASELVGSTILVTEDERPTLEQDEFYIPDLVGMTVALQESGQEIGVISDVFSTGGDNDLLQVSLLPSMDSTGGRKTWIPFVKDIVPIVDKELRRVEITPPKGLLELNAPTKGKDLKESRKQGIKERRKLRGKLAGLKKRLTAMSQTHVLAGLSSGTEELREAFVQQLLSIDFGLVQEALQEIRPSNSLVMPPKSSQPPEPPVPFPSVNWEHFDTWMDSSSSLTEVGRNSEDNVDMTQWWREGLQLVADGRVAVVVLAGGQSTRLGHTAPPVKGMVDLGLPSGKSLFQLQAERLLLVQELASRVVDPEFNPFIPWLVMTSDATDKSTREYFEEKHFFGLDESQVWFIKQDSMPCISLQLPEGHHDILLETPWKIAQAPNGNGGLFSALHQGAIDRLIEEGIDYVQVYAVDNALVRVADPVFFGYTKARGADVGVKVVNKRSPEEAVGVLCLEGLMCMEGKELEDLISMDKETSTQHYGVLEYSEMPEELRYALEENVEPEGSQVDNNTETVASREKQLKFRAAHICVNIFSVAYLKRLGDSDFKFKFHTALKRIPHVKREGNEWLQVVPEEPNGMKLELFIFDAFRFCDPNKVALLGVQRKEEFAPVKNSAGSGVPDSIDTACDLVLALERRLLSTFSEHSSPERQIIRKLLMSYLGGLINENVLELLDYPKDEQLPE